MQMTIAENGRKNSLVKLNIPVNSSMVMSGQSVDTCLKLWIRK